MYVTALLITGTLLLILGRKLFWLFVGAIGFATGWYFATNYLQGYSENFMLIIALVAGIVGIVLAIFVQKIAIGAAGFFGGGYFALNLLASLGQTGSQHSWVPFIIGGIIGAILVSILFDWALIVLSSLVGAVMIVQALHITSPASTILLLVLAAIGVGIQVRLMRGKQEVAES